MSDPTTTLQPTDLYQLNMMKAYLDHEQTRTGMKVRSAMCTAATLARNTPSDHTPMLGTLIAAANAIITIWHVYVLGKLKPNMTAKAYAIRRGNKRIRLDRRAAAITGCRIDAEQAPCRP
jgi:hypothetical protein